MGAAGGRREEAGGHRGGARRSFTRSPPQAAAPPGPAELVAGTLLRAAGGREESRTPRLIALELKGSAGRDGGGRPGRGGATPLPAAPLLQAAWARWGAAPSARRLRRPGE